MLPTQCSSNVKPRANSLVKPNTVANSGRILHRFSVSWWHWVGFVFINAEKILSFLSSSVWYFKLTILALLNSWFKYFMNHQDKIRKLSFQICTSLFVQKSFCLRAKWPGKIFSRLNPCLTEADHEPSRQEVTAFIISGGCTGVHVHCTATVHVYTLTFPSTCSLGPGPVLCSALPGMTSHCNQGQTSLKYFLL